MARLRGDLHRDAASSRLFVVDDQSTLTSRASFAAVRSLEGIKRGDKDQQSRQDRKRRNIRRAFAGFGIAVLGLALEAEVMTPRVVAYESGVPASAYQPVGIDSIGYAPTANAPLSAERTQTLVGYAKIEKLNVSEDLNGKGTYETYGQHLASLQLNATIYTKSEVKLGDKVLPEFNVLWAQDTAEFNTSKPSTVSFKSSINTITRFALDGRYVIALPTMPISQSEVSGRGGITEYMSNYYYTYETRPVSYSPGTSIYLAMNIAGQKEPVVQFDYAVGKNPKTGSIKDFDDMTLLLTKGPTQGYFNVTANYGPAQLVFGGPGQGDIAIFNQAEASIALYFKKDGEYLPLTVTGSGSSQAAVVTTEKAYNIMLMPSNYRYEVVTGNSYSQKVPHGNAPMAPLLEELNKRA